MNNILISIFILSAFHSCTAENSGQSRDTGFLSGVATFRDVYQSSDQPDEGCEIYALNEDDVKSTQYGDIRSVIENFQGNKYDYLLSVYYSIDPARNKRFQDNFDTIASSTRRSLSVFKQLPGIVKAVTSGTGNYTFSLRPGKYYLLFISGSVKSDNIAESRGNIGYKIVEVRSAQETFQHVTFLKYEMTGIMPVRNLSGC